MKKRSKSPMDVSIIADIINIPTQHWAGNCTRISQAFIDFGVAVGEVMRGHWLGPIATNSRFYGRSFTQHSWIETCDSTIVDPTRFAFEGVEPYVWHGDYSENYYDKGGNIIRSMLLKPCPPYNVAEREVTLVLNDVETEYIKEWIDDQGFNTLDGYVVSSSIAFWLANLPLTKLGLIAKSLYIALSAAGLKAAIPIDNYRMVMKR